MLTRYVFCSVLYSHQFKGHLDMIWACLICSNFIIFRLDIKLLAQHIHLLGWHLLGNFHIASQNSSLGVMQCYSHTSVCAFSLPLLKLCTLLNTCCVQVLSKNADNWNEYMMVWCLLSTVTTWSVCAHDNFATLVSVLWPLHWVMMQQSFTGLHN